MAGSGTLTLPTATGNLIGTGDTGTVTTAMIADANVTQAKLASNVVGNGPAFSAYLAANQTVTANVLTKVTLNTELFDTNSNFDSTTNYRFTPTVAGYYLIIGSVIASGSGLNAYGYIYKNGSQYTLLGSFPSASGSSSPILSGSSIISFNGTTDYVELWITTGGTTAQGGSVGTFMNGCLLRSA